MIFEALTIINEELKTYVDGVLGTLDNVTLGNIAMLESGESDIIRNRLIISLVNLEEESALKNSNGFHRASNGSIQYENPPVYLNLYLLFAANWPERYDNAIRAISLVIEFFQGKNIFTAQNSPGAADLLDTDDPEVLDLKLIVDLYTLTFEQINHLWGSLGGKQIPFAMYKVRLTRTHSGRRLKDGRLIERTDNRSDVID
ncbi:MAG: DUF4255 domain-containing protein [Lewinellaceae bacterium]|nr:DUF4255 domain-containing protein [Phaeodactylibacter sp.]MCB9041748.1 DUF4255 domain-containing protein [Lewinellaceae bacterium]